MSPLVRSSANILPERGHDEAITVLIKPKSFYGTLLQRLIYIVSLTKLITRDFFIGKCFSALNGKSKNIKGVWLISCL